MRIANTVTSPYSRLVTGLRSSSGVNHLEVDITIQSKTVVDTGTNPESGARIDGFFYNTQASGEAGDQTGDIWVSVEIQDTGEGLVAFWEVMESTNSDHSSMEPRGRNILIPLGTLLHDTAYRARVSYDGANGFTFEFNGVSETVTGPERQRNPVATFKGLTAYAYGTAGDAFTAAVFDNVATVSGGGIFDDFSTAPLDQARWNNREAVREIENGKARLNIQVDGAMDQLSMYFPDNTFDYFQARLRVESGSIVGAGASGLVRLAGYYYNETGPPYDGYKNDVWIAITISQDPTGSLSGLCSLWRMDTSSEWGAGTSLFSHPFATPLSVDTAYRLSIQRRGNQFVFGLNGEYHGYTVTTPMYEPATGQHRQIRTRIYADSGETGYMKTTVDDVVLKKVSVAPVTSLLLE
jgi:hypothetical protein